MSNYIRYNAINISNLIEDLSGKRDPLRPEESELERFDSLLMLSDTDFAQVFEGHQCEDNISELDGECLIHQVKQRREKAGVYGR